MKRTDEKLERIGIKIGNISKNQGSVAEEFFYNSLANGVTVLQRKGDTIESFVPTVA